MAGVSVVNGHGGHGDVSQGGYDPYGGGDASLRGVLYDCPPGEDGRRVSEGLEGGQGQGEVAELLSSEQFRQEVSEIVKEQLKFNASSASEQQSSARTYGVCDKLMMPIADIRGVDTLNYRKGEKVLRCKVAACYRLVDLCDLSRGMHTFISARLGSDQFLIAPLGLLFDEVTASSLAKLTLEGAVVDPGSTSLSACREESALHGAVYAARAGAACVVHISSPSAVTVSMMKCGLLPLCHEAMLLGQIDYHDFSGSVVDDREEREALTQALGSTSQVVFLRNFGALVCGETVEEAYRIASNVMVATDAQVNLIPVGVANMHLPSPQTIEAVYQADASPPTPGGDGGVKWGYGEVEFEGLMRRLDNDGYCTGYVYRADLVAARMQRSLSLAEASGKLSPLGERASGIATPLSQLLMRGKKPEWVVSPNAYSKEEEEVPDPAGAKGSKPKKISRWVSTDEMGNKMPKQRSQSMKAISANKFAPQGANPRELRDKVKEIRKEYFEDTITAGPQSTVLEGVTWEEAQRIKEGQPLNGVDNVRVTAASRGIIQREHQRDALFYKKYTLTNPFESITDADLDKYRRDVSKKNKKGGYGREAESEPEFLSERHQVAPQGARSATPPAKPARMSPVQQDYSQSYSKSYSVGPDFDEPEQRTVVKPVLTAQPQPKAEPTPSQQQKEPTVILAPIVPVKDRDFPQRSQSARYPAEKRPDLSDRGVLLDSSAIHASTLDRSSKENSPSRDSTLTKEKKKKKGLRFPSFSKKKEKVEKQ